MDCFRKKWEHPTRIRANENDNRNRPPAAGSCGSAAMKCPPCNSVAESTGRCRRNDEIRMTKSERSPNDEIRRPPLELGSAALDMRLFFGFRISAFGLRISGLGAVVFLGIVLPTGCAHYQARPLSPAQNAAALQNRSFANPTFRVFLPT